MKMGRVRKWLVVGMVVMGMAKGVAKVMGVVVVVMVVMVGINRVVVVVIRHRPQKTILATTKTPSRMN